MIFAAPALPAEQPSLRRAVRGSRPRGGPYAPVAQQAEHPPRKRDVAGSIPASGSQEITS